MGRGEINKNLVRLQRCLVGTWGDPLDKGPDLFSLKNWAFYDWWLNGNLYLALISGFLIFV